MTNTTFAVGGDIEVRRLGFGAMGITGPGTWGPPRDRAAARALLRRAVDLGAQLIDTADAYGPGAIGKGALSFTHTSLPLTCNPGRNGIPGLFCAFRPPFSGRNS